jgi:SnoaL-like domain
MAAGKQSIEERLQEVEDRLAILNLIAGHPPGADSASTQYSASYWLEGGVFDRGPPFDELMPSSGAARGPSPEFQEAIGQGICHFAGPPYIELHGDSATVTGYLQILAFNPSADEFTLSAHGTSRGFRVHRLSAGRWDLVRTKEGWRVERRTIRSMDTPEARALLRGVAERKMAASG